MLTTSSAARAISGTTTCATESCAGQPGCLHHDKVDRAVRGERGVDRHADVDRAVGGERGDGHRAAVDRAVRGERGCRPEDVGLATTLRGERGERRGAR